MHFVEKVCFLTRRANLICELQFRLSTPALWSCTGFSNYALSSRGLFFFCTFLCFLASISTCLLVKPR